MLKPKIAITEKDIEKILNGHDETKGIRYIDVSPYSPIATLFVKKEDGNGVEIMNETYSPFLWFKGFDFNRDFCYRYHSIPLEDIDSEGFFKSDVRYDFNEIFTFQGENQIGTHGIIREYIESINERRSFCFQKMKEYNITIKECITKTDVNKNIDRLENGYKFLAHIGQQKEKKYYENDLFGFYRSGNRKTINGSFQNIKDFFMEGGMDINTRSGVFLKMDVFLDFWSKTTKEQKVEFFLAVQPISEIFFNIEYQSDNTYDDVLDGDDKKYGVLISKDILSAYYETFNENVSQAKILSTLHKIYFKEDITNDTKNKILEILTNNVIELNYDDIKIKSIIDEEFNFASKKTFGYINEYLLSKDLELFYGEDKHFFYLTPLEQFMVQTGKRLFKGYDDYSSINIMSFDIETSALPEYQNDSRAALYPEKGEVFKIGIYCTNGFEEILSLDDYDESSMIERFFNIVLEQNPDILLGYNSEKFDFYFLVKRYQYLNGFNDELDAIRQISSSLLKYYQEEEEDDNDDEQDSEKETKKKKNNSSVRIWEGGLFTRRNSNLKVGGNMETYTQTNIYGINVIDTMAAVKRATALNKNIPNLKLKDNIIYAGLAKKNRVYIKGDEIGKIEKIKSPVFLNDETGDWFIYNKNIVFYENINDFSLKKSINYQYLKDENTFFFLNEHDYYKLILKSDEEIQNIYMVKYSKTKDFYSFVDEIFNLYYEKLKDEKIANISFSKTSFFGSEYKNDKDKYTYVMRKYKKLREDIKDKANFYPSRDFSSYREVSGSYIVHRYLIDDLWETIKLDEFYSQGTFMVSKWLPTSYQRAATMGGASIWKLLMSTYSYNYNVAIPEYDEGAEFSGGLVALLSLGWHGLSVKGDFNALYPSIAYTHLPEPDFDIFGIFKSFVKFGSENRTKFKNLKNQAEKDNDIELMKRYDVKQLPLKLLNNTFYGMLGAFAVTPFAHILSAQGVTCIGRQWLRHFTSFFERRGFKPTIAHTDGVFFECKNVDMSYKYIGRAKHKTVELNKEYEGLNAYFAEYNDKYMRGLMGLDIDEVVENNINFSKGNYVYLKNKKGKESVDVIGGAIIKKNQSEYIKDFFDANIKILLKGDASTFLNNYWDFIGIIKTYKIDLSKIATKAKIKKSKEEYLKHISGVNKKGQPLNKQVYMELLLNNNVDFEVGDWVYYVNTGENKRVKDSQTIHTNILQIDEYIDIIPLRNMLKDRQYEKAINFFRKLYETANLTILDKNHYGDFEGLFYPWKNWKEIKLTLKRLKNSIKIIVSKSEFVINSQLVDIDNANAQITYNSDLYVEKFNSAVHPLFICFTEEDRKKYFYNDKDNYIKPVIEKNIKMVSGVEFDITKPIQMDMSEFYTITDEEMEYWKKSNRKPEDFKELMIPTHFN
jgi:DNA polymerase elongation subunit (family B)